MGHEHAHERQTSPYDLSRSEAQRRRERRRLAVAMVLTTTIMVAEALGGWVSNSLALLSDAAHMMADVAALLIALLAVMLAARPADSRRTYGYYRLEILAALANGVLLGVMAVFIVFEAWERFQAPEPIQTGTVLAVGSVGLVANVLGMVLLNRFQKASLGTRGVYLHILGDTISSVGVIAGALVIQYTGWNIIDPILSVGIAGIIVFSSIRLIRECVDVLLQGVPLGMELDAIERAIESIAGVGEVHDIHVWTITSGMVTFSCHITVEEGCSQPECDRILVAAKEMLAERFGILHSTIQIEGQAYEEVGHVH